MKINPSHGVLCCVFAPLLPFPLSLQRGILAVFSATEELPHFLFDTRLFPPARADSVIHSNLRSSFYLPCMPLSFIVVNNGEKTSQGFTPDYFPTWRVLINQADLSVHSAIDRVAASALSVTEEPELTLFLRFFPSWLLFVPACLPA